MVSQSRRERFSGGRRCVLVLSPHVMWRLSACNSRVQCRECVVVEQTSALYHAPPVELPSCYITAVPTKRHCLYYRSTVNEFYCCNTNLDVKNLPSRRFYYNRILHSRELTIKIAVFCHSIRPIHCDSKALLLRHFIFMDSRGD